MFNVGHVRDMATFNLCNGDSKKSQNEEEDHVSNVELARFLFTVCSYVQKTTLNVAIEIVHCYNNIVSIDDVTTSESDVTFCQILK